MKIVNPTPLRFAPFAGRMNFPRHSMTLIVKGTFDLVPDGKAEFAEEQAFPTGDVFHDDDDEGTGSARYESDFAHFKPRADLLLAGRCLPPGGHEATACSVRFDVGGYAKELIVTGDRRWRGPRGLRTMSAPEPFREKVIRYEAAFGGEGHEPNPVGTGLHKQDTEAFGEVRLVPNVESPDDRVGTGLSRPAPAGFGPLGRQWKARASLLGTYKRSWLKNRWPWFPEDFDFGHYNAAPPDMQVPYLRGDEALAMENLHPEHSEYRSRLPGLRVRAFVNQGEVDPDRPPARFDEVEMNLDTLWVDMDAGQVVLVWRGFVDVESSEYEDVDHVYVRAEEVKETPASREICWQEFAQHLDEAEEVPEEEEIPEAQQEEEEERAIAVETPPLPDAETAKETAKEESRAATIALLADAGFAIDELSPEAEAILDQAAEPDPEAAEAAARDSAEARTKEQFAKLGLDPENLPAPSAKARAEQARMLSEMGVENVDEFMADPEMAAMLATLNAALPKAGIDPEDLSGIVEQVKKLPGLGAELPDTPEAEPEPERIRPLTREIVEVEAARGESFAQEDLSELDLSGLDLAGLDFSEANFAGTKLVETDFTGCLVAGANFEGADMTTAILPALDFTGANLKAAVLTEATLAEANLAGCAFEATVLDGADLTAATLTGCTFQGASCVATTFEGAQMQGIAATESTWVSAYLKGADLSEANLAACDLTTASLADAVLTAARFEGATLLDATLEGVSCAGGVFRGADCTRLRASGGSDFSGADFSAVQAAESIWEAAKLDRALFTQAKLPGANFPKASLQGANFDAADMPQARFMRCDLTSATLREANVFEGSFEGSNLQDADLSGANLYCAEFFEAEAEEARFDGANLKATKLA